MSNLAKLEFRALDITGDNYLPWVLDSEIHLAATNLGNTIKAGNQCTNQEKAKAMIFLRHHLHEDLKTEYLTVKDPLVLWNSLKDRFDHQKTVILPKARYEWLNLRLQDFKSVIEYNSAVHRITSKMSLCGEKITDEEMLEKTFSTFHASNVILQQQYREKGFKKYGELIACLMVAEQNNELLMKNHETRPTGTNPLPEANVAKYNGPHGDHARGRFFGRGRDRGRGNGYGRGRGRGYGRGVHHGVQFKKTYNDKKWHGFEKNSKYEHGESSRNTTCYRCGSEDHWVKTCHTPEHLVELYRKSLENKGKGIESNFVYENNEDARMGNHEVNTETTHLDADDFFTNE